MKVPSPTGFFLECLAMHNMQKREDTYTKGPVAKDHYEEVDEVTEKHVGVDVRSDPVHWVEEVLEEVAEGFHIARDTAERASMSSGLNKAAKKKLG